MSIESVSEQLKKINNKITIFQHDLEQDEHNLNLYLGELEELGFRTSSQNLNDLEKELQTLLDNLKEEKQKFEEENSVKVEKLLEDLNELQEQLNNVE